MYLIFEDFSNTVQADRIFPFSWWRSTQCCTPYTLCLLVGWEAKDATHLPGQATVVDQLKQVVWTPIKWHWAKVTKVQNESGGRDRGFALRFGRGASLGCDRRRTLLRGYSARSSFTLWSSKQQYKLCQCKCNFSFWKILSQCLKIQFLKLFGAKLQIFKSWQLLIITAEHYRELLSIVQFKSLLKIAENYI